MIFYPCYGHWGSTQSLSQQFHFPLTFDNFLKKEGKTALAVCLVLFVFCYVHPSLLMLTKRCKLYSFCLLFSMIIAIYFLFFGFQFHFKCVFLLVGS